MSMSVEAVVLTGGASRRMGRDKASLLVEDTPLALRVIQELEAVVSKVSVLGREGISGYTFIADTEEYAGPLNALKSFNPSEEFVFVASCDLPQFQSDVVGVCMEAIGEADACVPVVDGSRQPLCALYRAACFAVMRDCASRSMMGFLDSVTTVEVDEEALVASGVSLASIRNANTPEELAELTDGVDGK